MHSWILWMAMPALGLATAQLDCTTSALNSVLFSKPTKITNATFYANGTYLLAGATNKLDFCAVDADLVYGKNSTLHFSVWLPERNEYKGRFMAVGNGGLAGTIDFNNMLDQLNAGYGFAVAGGDAGHRASDNTGVYLPFLHDPDQTKAWIHNAISLFTPVARHLSEVYYGFKAKHSYYNGCSTGGAQGFALVNFHPALFDGVIAGSPGNWYSHLMLSFLWNAQQTKRASSMLSQEQLTAMTNAVLKQCDGIDGVNDGLIENPLDCKFDISAFRCGSESSNESTCLNADQLSAAEAIYQGPVDTCNGDQIYPGFSLGSETEWQLQEGALADIFSIPLLRNLVYNDLNWNPDDFDWQSDVEIVNEKAGRLIDEKSSDLSAFYHRGGKLLVTQGWTDPFNAASWPIDHLSQVRQHIANVDDFYRLFMVPGGGHCGAANNYPSVPASYHTVDQMIRWVELGHAPEYVLSSNPPDGSNRTRRLCPWPQTARYSNGSIDDWTSYRCQ